MGLTPLSERFSPSYNEHDCIGDYQTATRHILHCRLIEQKLWLARGRQRNIRLDVVVSGESMARGTTHIRRVNGELSGEAEHVNRGAPMYMLWSVIPSNYKVG